MNVLIVSMRAPTPVTKGDQVLVWNRIKALNRRGHRVVLCLVYSEKRELSTLQDVKPYCARIFSHRLPLWRRALNLAIAGVASDVPLQVALFKDARLSALVSEIVAAESIDLINAFLIRSFPAVEDQPIPLILDLGDSMMLNVRRRIPLAPFWLRPVLRTEARRLQQYERHACEKSAASLVVANADGEAIGGPRLSVVPLGVDSEEFHPSETSRVPGRVVFSGNMNYHANRAALDWFAESCWERITERRSGVELCVVGTGAERLASRYGRLPGIRLVGRVPSMGDFLRTADVSVAPMQSGSGMQSKVLEAMACGVPTVVTTLGLSDIHAEHGRHTLVADTGPEFVAAVCRLLEDRQLHAEIARRATELVNAQYTWAANVAEFERIAVACLSGKSSALGSLSCRY